MSKDFIKDKTYLPAAGKDWLLPLYDPAINFFGLDSYYYRLIELTDLVPPLKMLDIGCGTGSLGKIIKQSIPAVYFTGIDPDPKALAIAIRKLGQYPRVQLDLGNCDRLPYADASFDHVVSSFVFHHLGEKEKIGMLHEVRRVLKSGSVFSSVDFDRSNGCGTTENQSLPDLLLQAGFHSVEVESEKHWLLGKVSFYLAI